MNLERRLKWMTYRLRTMKAAEIVSRLSDVGRHLVLSVSEQRIRRRAQRRLKGATCHPKVPLWTHDIQSAGKEEQTRAMAHAEEWLQHRASFFALHAVPLGKSIDWHRDYASGRTGPLRYSGLINYREAAIIGDVKYIWELNRLQHLVPLALACVWTGNQAYEEEIESQILSWCAQNPFMKGLNWKSPLEAGMRLISLAFVSWLSAGSNRLGNLLHRQLSEVIYQHQYFINAFFSKHSSANNHLIGEMAGLYVASVFWPGYQESLAWHSLARRKLIEEITRQVEPDGVGKERASEYQLFILELFLLAGALGHAIGEPFPQEYWDQLTRMMTFLAAVSDRQGHLPMWGDGDSGQVVWLPLTIEERVSRLVRLGRSCHQPEAGEITDLWSLFLLWGRRPEELPLDPIPEPDRCLQAFPQGGYYVLATDRGGEGEMIVGFDAGALGFPPLYAHGHADALSFWLSYGGHEFLIDPGTFCYYTHDLWRGYFRGTSAHNTVRIDGENQSVIGGRFLWNHAASCQIEHVEEREDRIDLAAYHNGYQRLADPVLHRRHVRLYKQSRRVVISDTLECQSNHDVELFFHFSEQCHVWQVAPHTFEAVNGNKRLRIQLASQLRPQLYYGSENPLAGWVSRTYGIKESSFTLMACTNVTGTTQLLTEIRAL